MQFVMLADAELPSGGRPLDSGHHPEAARARIAFGRNQRVLNLMSWPEMTNEDLSFGENFPEI